MIGWVLGIIAVLLIGVIYSTYINVHYKLYEDEHKASIVMIFISGIIVWPFYLVAFTAARFAKKKPLYEAVYEEE